MATPLFKKILTGARRVYLLCDRFDDTRAAGAVNGTFASPGPGVRTVTDTNGKISITGGVLSFATGAVANDALWFGSIVRATGRVLFGRLTPPEVTNGIPVFGWDSAASGAILDCLKFGASGVLQIVANGGTAFSVGAYTATTYDIAAVMRATGLFWFIKGGAFTNWMLLYMTAAGTAAGFPAIQAANTTAVFTADNILIPAQTFPVVPSASDSFTRADGVLGSSDGLGHEEANGGNGLAWQFDAGVWTIATNKAVGTPTEGLGLLTDGGLEANYTGGLCDSLLLQSTPTVVESADVHGGSKAQSVIGNAANDGVRFPTYAANVGAWYHLSAWGKRAAGTQAWAYLSVNNGGVTSYFDIWTSAVYVQQNAVIRAAGTGNIVFYPILQVNGGGGDTIIVDDCSLAALTLSSLFATVNAATPHVKVRATVAALTTQTQAGLVARLDSATTPANFLIAYFTGTGTVKLDECVAGVYTNLASVAKAFTASDTLELDMSGTAFRLYHVTNAQAHTLIASGTVTTTTGNLHGLFSTFASNTFSSCVIYSKGTEGQWESLRGLL